MIDTTQMLTIFEIVCLIILTRSVSFTDEKLSQNPQCIKPINHKLKITYMQHYNNTLQVFSRLKVNVSCTLRNIRLVSDNSYGGTGFSIDGTTPDIYIDFNTLYWEVESLWFPFTKDRSRNWNVKNYRLTEQITNNNIINGTLKGRSRTKDISPGIYRIQTIYYCSIDKVFTALPYVHQSEEKKYLLLPRIPSKWIVPHLEIPPMKSKFTIQIYHNVSETYALSHMPGEIMFDEIQNKSYTLFSITPVMSSYLVAAVVVPRETIKSSSLLKNVIVTSRPQVKNDISYARLLIRDIILRVRCKWENISWSHVSYVVLPINHSHYESIITKNLVIFNEADIKCYDEIDSITRKKEVTCLVARSVIQEMFSDWLATFEQSDSWFIEGFLTFYGVYIIDQMYVEPLLKSLVVQTRREILDCTEAFITYELPFNENYSFISPSSIFIKLWRKHAFSIFYMISEYYENVMVYHSMFKEAINLYYNTLSSDMYNIQSSFNNLWRKLIFEMSTHKNMSLIRNLTTVIISWTHIGYPLIQVVRPNNIRTLDIIIRDCFLSNPQSSCLNIWWIPVTYVKIPQLNIRYKSFLQPDEQNIEISNIEENDSVILIDQPGYRVNYDHKSWENIAFFLKTKKSKMSDLSDITLAQILDDAFYFLIQNTDYNENPASNIDNLDIFFDLASSIFHVNNSYIAWYPIFTVFEYLSKIYPFPESAYIKNKLLTILNTFLENMSHTPSSENSVNNQFYYEVLKWTCILDGVKCKDIVSADLMWHMHNPAKNKFLPSWQKWIYCQGLMLENLIYKTSSIWNALLNMYQTQSKVGEIFEFLLCSKHSENILISVYFYLTSFLSSYEHDAILKKSDSVTLLFNSFVKHSKNVASLMSILEGIEFHTKKRDINIVAIITCIINNIYSEEGLLMIIDKKFLQMLMDLYFAPSFLIDAIEEKAVNRRKFLSEIRNKLRHRPYDATYRYLFVE